VGKHKEALKQAIKDEFFGRLRQASPGGDARRPELDPAWLYEDFLPSLSPGEEAALEEVLAELLHEGILVRTGGRRATYRLTQKGADLLRL